MVGFTVLVADHDPGADLAGYDDVVEIDFQARSTTLRLVEWAAEAVHELPPLPLADGNYRALGHVFGELQRRQQYEIRPTVPTATCHLQSREQADAACGYPWEGLVRVPDNPAWPELSDWLRCDECEDAVGFDQLR